MPGQLQFRRIRFSRDADVWLRTLKARTGITPNILCRVGLCLSLAEAGDPAGTRHDEDSDREISRGVLLGDFEQTLTTLVRQRWAADVAAGQSLDLDTYFCAHVHRGIQLLAARVKSLLELGGMFG